MMQSPWVKKINELEVTPPPLIREWLENAFILSKALRRICQNLSVKVLSQCYMPAHDDEYQALAIAKTTDPLVRQVLLLGDGSPLSYGRVVVPVETAKAYSEHFSELGSAPIGEAMLYNNPEVKRMPFEYTILDANSLFFKELTDHALAFSATPLFGRRSIFWLKEYPILVSEILVPTIPTYQSE